MYAAIACQELKSCSDPEHPDHHNTITHQSGGYLTGFLVNWLARAQYGCIKVHIDIATYKDRGDEEIQKIMAPFDVVEERSFAPE